MATEPIATAQITKASGAHGPIQAASAAGTAKIPAPTMMLMMLAASATGPTARTRPTSRRCSAAGRPSSATSCAVIALVGSAFGFIHARSCFPARNQCIEILHRPRAAERSAAAAHVIVDSHTQRPQLCGGLQPRIDRPIHGRVELQQRSQRVYGDFRLGIRRYLTEQELRRPRNVGLYLAYRIDSLGSNEGTTRLVPSARLQGGHGDPSPRRAELAERLMSGAPLQAVG